MIHSYYLIQVKVSHIQKREIVMYINTGQGDYYITVAYRNKHKYRNAFCYLIVSSGLNKIVIDFEWRG